MEDAASEEAASEASELARGGEAVGPVEPRERSSERTTREVEGAEEDPREAAFQRRKTEADRERRDAQREVDFERRKAESDRETRGASSSVSQSSAEPVYKPTLSRAQPACLARAT